MATVLWEIKRQGAGLWEGLFKMLLFGHIGITLAAAKAIERIVAALGANKAVHFFDYRFLLPGAVLPDLIDKPLGGFILRESLGNGRIYAHTFLFFALLLAAGAVLSRGRKKPVFTLAVGCLAHHILDGMWRDPKTYLWPAYGWSFPQGDPQSWFWRWVVSFFNDPGVYLPELIGAAAIFFLAAKAVFRRRERAKS